MTLSYDDRVAITDLILLHGHLCDDGALDRFGEVFSPDVVYDLVDVGGGELRGIAAIRDAALAMGDRNPVGHHVTNVLLREAADGEVRARSKWIGVRGDGTVGSGVYDDVVTRGLTGWRISRRAVVMRRIPLSGVTG
jgi:3-phenylpropionate/cinnamic acid dioxygenase small subunit